MNARFDTLKRGRAYTFVFGAGVTALSGTFHEIGPDGCLIVGAEGGTYYLNPDAVSYAREGGN